RRRHTRFSRDWSSDVCSSDLPGFEEFLDAMADPKHPEHDSVMTWYGRFFDPTDIGLDAITARLAKFARRRAQGKAAFEKSRNRRSEERRVGKEWRSRWWTRAG